MLSQRTSSAAQNLPLLQSFSGGGATANNNSPITLARNNNNNSSSAASLSSSSGGSDSENEPLVDTSSKSRSPSNSSMFFKRGGDKLLQKNEFFRKCVQLRLGGWRLCYICLLVFLIPLPIHRLLVWRLRSRTWVFSPNMSIERPCPPPEYATLANDPAGNDLKICLTTLTDAKTQKEASPLRKIVRWRNYDDILNLTWDSRQKYADKHGYYLFDSSHLVDVSRPAQWSKIIAVQHLLKVEKCDWVLWHDADTLFMNTDFRIQNILPSDPNIDVLVAVDTPNPGFNSGSWLVKNSEWGRQFLQDWWDMKSFVRLPGQSLSGDNDAFKALLASYSRTDFDTHIGVPPRCTINAFAKFLRPKQKKHMTEEQLKKQPWYLSENFYHKGDFMVHVAGYDNKAGTLQMLMDEIH